MSTSVGTPRGTRAIDLDAPPPLLPVKYDSQTRVIHDQHLVCTLKPPCYRSTVLARCAHILGPTSGGLWIAPMNETELYVDCSEPLPVLSENAVTCRLLSGQQVQIPAKLPVGLAYVFLAETLGCTLDQLQLVYACSCGCAKHTHRGDAAAGKNHDINNFLGFGAPTWQQEPAPGLLYPDGENYDIDNFPRFGTANWQQNTAPRLLCPLLGDGEIQVLLSPHLDPELTVLPVPVDPRAE